jgi:HAD superfamily hydrolase (TIGR01509 family)
VPLYKELLEIAGGKERIQFYCDRYQPTFVPPTDTWIAQLHAAKNQHYQQMLNDGLIPLRPGVRRLIQEAREEGIRLAIATTSRLDNVVMLLETALEADSPEWFEVIAAGDIVPAKKPAPDIYQYVLQAMNLSPDACLAIEDSNQGLRASTAAGLKTVITTNHYTQDQNFTTAALTLNHLGDLNRPCEPIDASLIRSTCFDLALARDLCKRQAEETGVLQQFAALSMSG